MNILGEMRLPKICMVSSFGVVLSTSHIPNYQNIVFCHFVCLSFFQHLCRQGREAVQVTYELDVMATEYIEHESTIPAGDLTQDGRVLPVDVRTVRKGRLHLRLANVGHPADNKFSKTGSVPQPVKPKTIVKGGTSSSAFLGGSLNALNSHTKGETKILQIFS